MFRVRRLNPEPRHFGSDCNACTISQIVTILSARTVASPKELVWYDEALAPGVNSRAKSLKTQREASENHLASASVSKYTTPAEIRK